MDVEHKVLLRVIHNHKKVTDTSKPTPLSAKRNTRHRRQSPFDVIGQQSEKPIYATGFEAIVSLKHQVFVFFAHGVAPVGGASTGFRQVSQGEPALKRHDRVRVFSWIVCLPLESACERILFQPDKRTDNKNRAPIRPWCNADDGSRLQGMLKAGDEESI